MLFMMYKLCTAAIVLLSCSVSGLYNDYASQSWPPSAAEALVDLSDGRLDLAIKPLVKRPARNGYLANHTELLLRSLAPDVKVAANSSQLLRMATLQYSLLQQREHPQYSLYPQVLNTREVVRSVKFGEAVDEDPINDPSLKPIRTPSALCQQSNREWPDLVIVVQSCLDCTATRQHARDTFMKPSLWSEFVVKFVFVIAIPSSKLKVNDPKEFMRLFPEVAAESDNNNDLLIGGPFEDTLVQTWAHILSFRWLSIFCQEHVPVYLFLNPEFSVTPSNMITFLRGIPRNLQLILNAGLRPSTFQVPRHGEGKIDPEEIPWSRYPEHYDDSAFFVGAELLTEASITMAFTKPHRNSAAYLGFIWAKLDYPSLHLPEVICKSGNWSDVYAASVSRTVDLDRYMDWSNGFFFNP
ncbi:unnamed protein product [Echinostoma caproni]|uniref:Hexosyltransferase n=1 Tax=Echinostoma caproni TaxID=27848 RepID=A0A183AHG4_9TREM|nr:unnamed protein product [Echinostoma caproni]